MIGSIIRPVMRPLVRSIIGEPSAAPAPAPAFDPASLFADGQNGLVLNGFPGGSDFYETSAKAALVAASTDPCGAISDVSGVGNDAIQTLSLNRATYYVNGGGIRSWRTGDNRLLYPETDLFVTAAMAYVCVYKYISQSSDGAPLISSYASGWGAGGYFTICGRVSTPDDDIQVLCDSGVTGQTIDGALSGSDAAIIHWNRAGTGSNQSVATTYETDGTQIATSTGTQNATPANVVSLGYRALASGGVVEKCFELVRDEPLTAQEWTDLSDYLTTKLAGGW